MFIKRITEKDFQRKYITSLVFLSSLSALSQEKSDEKITVSGSKINIAPTQESGLSEEELNNMKFQDLEEAMSILPGVTIQTEDGYGLRTNVGLRGTNPQRTKKINVMEDGVPIAPAPYTAPAAYYFPNIARTANIDVYKGYEALFFHPNNLGGALNFVTKDIPLEFESILGVNYGSYNLMNFNLYTGGTSYFDVGSSSLGWLITYDIKTADGFQEVPSGADVGFVKRDFMAKLRYDWDGDNFTHAIKLKIGYGNEGSNASYLGISEDDFNEDYLQRYAASETDRMVWEHRQAVASYSAISVTGDEYLVDAYYNDFRRSWDKVSGFSDDNTNLRDIILYPGEGNNQSFLDILKGKEDTSAGDGSDQIVKTDAARDYISKGIQFRGINNFKVLTLESGARIHQDSIERNHSDTYFEMLEGSLDYIDGSKIVTKENMDTANSLSGWANVEVPVYSFYLSAGLLVDGIELENSNKMNPSSSKEGKSETNISKGASAKYKLDDQSFILGSYYNTLGAPPLDKEIDSESVDSFELGYAYKLKEKSFNATAFYSLYAALQGTCTQQSGCATEDLDKTYEAGEAKVYGLETLYKNTYKYDDLRFPVWLTYTYTYAGFNEDTVSNSSEWGPSEGSYLIKKGDPLPYIADHVASLMLGVEKPYGGLFLLTKYVGERFDQSAEESRLKLDPYIVNDLSGNYVINKNFQIDMRIANIFDTKFVSSLRPYGFRPGKPREMIIGLKAKI